MAHTRFRGHKHASAKWKGCHATLHFPIRSLISFGPLKWEIEGVNIRDFLVSDNANTSRS